jgi:SAM-dependent methyltransferase
MLNPWQDKAVSWLYRQARRLMRGGLRCIPGGKWLLEWTDPLHIARHLLWQAVQSRAHYARGRLLDIGCGYQPYRHLFTQVDSYVGVDLPPNNRVEAHADGMELPFLAASFDTVLCNEVLEHVPEPAKLIGEVTRVLKEGGILLLTTPQTWGLHHEPYDYYRYTKYGLRYLAEKYNLEIIEVTPTSGLWATVAQRIADTLIYTYAVDSAAWVVELLSVALGPLLFASYALDQVFGLRGDTLDNVLVARKPPA